MSSDLDDDEDIFYGSGKTASKKKESTPAEESASYSHDYLRPPDEAPRTSDYEDVAPAQEPKQEKDIEAERAQTRKNKMRAEEFHDITIIRKRAAKHSAEAAKLFKRYRAEEAAMVKYQENSNKARRKAEKYLEKGKDAMAKADNKQADLEYLEGGKAERARVKVAKLKAKAAKMKSKSSSWMNNSAKNTEKAASKRIKAESLLEQSQSHEAEALNSTKRADNLSKIQGK